MAPRVIKTMYNSSRSAVLLEGEKSPTFSVEQGVAQGCSLSPILFSVFISDLLGEIDRAQIGIQLKSGNQVGRCFTFRRCFCRHYRII